MTDPGTRFDQVLLGGDVIDGSGRPARREDVGIRDGRVAALGDLAAAAAVDRVDVGGLVVCPGFVDIHAHADLMTLAYPDATNKIQQGITTEVVGNCGSGIAPVSTPDLLPELRSLQGSIEVASVEWDWLDVAGYLDRVALASPAVSTAVLVGHLPLRASSVGFAARPADETELAQMCGDLDRALRQGAVGLSFGLMRPPSSYATSEEMVRLAQVVASHDALLAVHLRDYGGDLLVAVEEMLDVAARAGCRLQVSHLAAVGQANWGLPGRALALIDAAAADGVDVCCDIYPYLAGSTSLSQKLPRWALDGGSAQLRRRLVDPEIRRRLVVELEAGSPRWEDTLLAHVPQDASLNGCTLAEVAERWRCPPAQAVLDLLRESDPTMIAFGRSEEDLRTVLAHPRSMIGSDGLAVLPSAASGGSVPHPRAFGAYPGFFQRYVREDPVVSLPEAVAMCTSAPADRARLHDRGRLTVGSRADVVVFDPETIAERSTYVAPRQAPVGIAHVIANGVMVLRDARVTGDRGNGPVGRE